MKEFKDMNYDELFDYCYDKDLVDCGCNYICDCYNEYEDYSRYDYLYDQYDKEDLIQIIKDSVKKLQDNKLIELQLAEDLKSNDYNKRLRAEIIINQRNKIEDMFWNGSYTTEDKLNQILNDGPKKES